ncbi:MAG: hypothetical protein HXS47_06955 [Theionarchaea archaeon]|nr:hypothetical protein [Theionarchaea archaeon]
MDREHCMQGTFISCIARLYTSHLRYIIAFFIHYIMIGCNPDKYVQVESTAETVCRGCTE